ncbi:MAG: RecQ family ATP-dependent DNA helicase [Chloroflexota bacterium]
MAREALGLRRLLPGQEEGVASVIGGRDTLALLPTGGGKSAIYQLAGVDRPGATIVVSPLIALQRDQLEALDAHDIGGAAALNSTLPEPERAAVLDDFVAGRLEFLLLGPEQLSSTDVVERLAAANVSLFVVDEAHCVSEWGHDFRPEYRRLGEVARVLGRPPILALTATASPAVRDEIVEWLGMRDPLVVARGFDRPNLRLEVRTFADDGSKRRAALDLVRESSGAAIVYAATRRAAEDLAAELAADGIDAAAYHAGLPAGRRSEVQDAFRADGIRVVVATIAFGMGIDKPNVRLVVHLDVPDGLDAYHQEIGRAGRDGEPASATLLYRAEDLGLRRFQGAPAVVEEADVRAVLRMLGRGGGTTAEIATATRRSRRRTEAIVSRLEALGAARVTHDGVVSLHEDVDRMGLAAQVVAAQERRRRLAQSRVEMLRGYAESPGCRRRYLLNYLGEEYEPPCGSCDRCAAAGTAAAASTSPVVVDETSGPFALNDRVRHAKYGPGLVSRVEGDRIVVLFDDVGYRTLDLEACLTGGLLVAADHGVD